jgi:hypothetical protein
MKLNLENGLLTRIGFCRKIIWELSWFSFKSCYLKTKSIRSEKGKSPVPPATMIILPGAVSLSSSPLPNGILSFRFWFELKLCLLNRGVNFP